MLATPLKPGTLLGRSLMRLGPRTAARIGFSYLIVQFSPCARPHWTAMRGAHWQLACLQSLEAHRARSGEAHSPHMDGGMLRSARDGIVHPSRRSFVRSRTSGLREMFPYTARAVPVA